MTTLYLTKNQATKLQAVGIHTPIVTRVMVSEPMMSVKVSSQVFKMCPYLSQDMPYTWDYDMESNVNCLLGNYRVKPTYKYALTFELIGGLVQTVIALDKGFIMLGTYNPNQTITAIKLGAIDGLHAYAMATLALEAKELLAPNALMFVQDKTIVKALTENHFFAVSASYRRDLKLLFNEIALETRHNTTVVKLCDPADNVFKMVHKTVC